MRQLMRGVLIGGAFALVAGLSLAASAGTALNVGKADANASPILPVNVGAQLGIFARHGVDVKVSDFTGGSKMAQAMVAGSIDIGVGAGTEMALVAKGAPIRAVCDDAPPLTFIGFGVPWDSPIHTVDQLKGTKVGVSSAGSLSDWLAKRLAGVKGWGPDGVTRVAIGNGATAVLAAFKTNAIQSDVSVTSNIFNWEEKKEGRLLISASSYVGNAAAGTIYATTALMDKDPAAIRSFLAGWLDTIAYMRQHKAETVKIESATTGYSQTAMGKEYDLTIGMFSNDCRFDKESLDTLKEAFIEQKLVAAPPDMSTLYTEAFLPK